MSKVKPHPTDKGKYQSTFDKYGHGKGNGKSRAAVYKHYKKSVTSDMISEVQKTDKNTTKKNRDTESLSDFTKTDQSQESSTKTDQWEDISWLSDDDLSGVRPTIASPIRKLASGEGGMSVAQRATQSQLIRWGYMGLDRGVTHWGRGVMNSPDWEIQRHPQDYDALEAATNHAMEANGLSINLSPTLVWGVVMGAAYGPPLGHIARNSDPLLRKTALRRFGAWIMKPSQWFRRRKSEPIVQRTFHGNTFRDEPDED